MLSQLTRTLATVLRGGIPLVQALDTTAGVINNTIMAQRMIAAPRTGDRRREPRKCS